MADGSIRCDICSIPKPGNTPGENEDFAAHRGTRIAMSDGASTTARSEAWARLLVTSYMDGADPLDPQQLAALRAQWTAQVTSIDLPWHAIAKINDGGAATLLCLEVDTSAHRYLARAVGDSCLLHLRDGDIQQAGPHQHPHEFSRAPALISTLPGDSRHQSAIWAHTSSYAPGDVLVLATDAAAKYLLSTSSEALQELTRTNLLEDLAEFTDWAEHARAAGELEPDDTTVCVVRL